MKILAAVLVIVTSSTLAKDFPSGWSERFIDGKGRTSNETNIARAVPPATSANSTSVTSPADKVTLSKSPKSKSAIRVSGIVGVTFATGTSPSPIKTPATAVVRR